MLEQLFKDLDVTPAGEAFIDGVPVAVLVWQESPLRAGACDPQDGFEEAAHVASGSEPYGGDRFSERAEFSAIGHRLAKLSSCRTV